LSYLKPTSTFLFECKQATTTTTTTTRF